jgi:hypothetical protein
LQTAREVVTKNNRRGLELTGQCRSLEEKEQESEIVTWFASTSVDAVEMVL